MQNLPQLSSAHTREYVSSDPLPRPLAFVPCMPPFVPPSVLLALLSRPLVPACYLRGVLLVCLLCCACVVLSHGVGGVCRVVLLCCSVCGRLCAGACVVLCGAWFSSVVCGAWRGGGSVSRPQCRVVWLVCCSLGCCVPDVPERMCAQPRQPEPVYSYALARICVHRCAASQLVRLL